MATTRKPIDHRKVYHYHKVCEKTSCHRFKSVLFIKTDLHDETFCMDALPVCKFDIIMGYVPSIAVAKIL